MPRNRLSETLSDANRGLVGGFLGGPVDIANTLMLGAGGEKPFAGSAWWGDRMQDMGMAGPSRNQLAEAAFGLLTPGAPAKVGMLAGAHANTLLGLLGATAYHGTPHVVDMFKMDKIGTGEGAQVYGHGMYFAENKSVADQYRRDLSDEISVDGKPIQKRNKKVGTTGNAAIDDIIMANRGDIDAAIAQQRQWLADFEQSAPHAAAETREELAHLEALRGRVSVGNDGNLYEVEIPDPPELFDWDSPLSQQPDGIRQAITRYAQDNPADILASEMYAGVNAVTPQHAEMTGSEIYQRLKQQPHLLPKGLWGVGKNEQQAASEYLHRMSIPGLKFLDQGSRAPGKIFNVGSDDASFGPATPFSSMEEAQKNLDMVRRYHPRARITVQDQPQTHNYVIWDESRIGKPKKVK